MQKFLHGVGSEQRALYSLDTQEIETTHIKSDNGILFSNYILYTESHRIMAYRRA